MQLRIGALARQAGLTVRTLHHYDAIGLLCPSGRSEGGYRLYDQADVMRLQAILALRDFGCSLAAISEALAAGLAVLPDLLSRQIEALETRERQARDLREKLCRLRERVMRNENTTMDEWLDILGKMVIFGKYFSAEELAVLRTGFAFEAGVVGRDWQDLAAGVEAALVRGVAPDSDEAAGLVRPMVDLARRMTGGDRALAVRLREMLGREERVRQAAGLSEAGLAWFDRAVAALRERQAAAPSGTALAVATLRAAHQLLDAPLVFVDPLACAVVGPGREAAIRSDPARFDAGRMRGLRASVAVRSRFAEDAWAGARDRGVRQYVILGAGFDTFAYRTDDRVSRIFEVDLPGTQAEKKKRLKAAGIARPDNLAFVPLDFEARTLAETLGAAGFRREEPAFFSWLGVAMYLTEVMVWEVLAAIAGLAAGTQAVFDYPVAPECLTPAERQAREAVMARCAARGEPWRSAFSPAAMRKGLSGLGFGAVEDLDGPELTARYLAGRTDGLVKSGLTRIALATVAGPAV